MTGINRKILLTVSIIIIIAAASTAAIFGLLYYSGAFLPKWAKWHDVVIDTISETCCTDGRETHINLSEDKENPDRIELVKKKVKAYKDGRLIYTSPGICRVQNMFYADIDRDGENELILLNFNLGRYGKHRPFWIKRDKPVWYQHIYIYDYVSEDEMFRPIWMASDIGMEAADFSLKDKNVIEMEDRHGNRSDWMWISFGLRCVD